MQDNSYAGFVFWALKTCHLLELSVFLKGLFIATHLTSPVIVDAVSFVYKTE